MEALLTGGFVQDLCLGYVPHRCEWLDPFEGELPTAGTVVEMKLYGETRILHGEFLWNGFWLLDDGTMINGGRVAAWRTVR